MGVKTDLFLIVADFPSGHDWCFFALKKNNTNSSFLPKTVVTLDVPTLLVACDTPQKSDSFDVSIGIKILLFRVLVAIEPGHSLLTVLLPQTVWYTFVDGLSFY